VLAEGNYANSGMNINSSTTTAASLTVHGGAATVTGTGDGSLFSLAVPTTIRNLNIVFPSGTAIDVIAPSILENLTIDAGYGMRVTGTATMSGVRIKAFYTSVHVTGTLIADRAVLQGGNAGIIAEDGARVDITNMLVSNTSNVGINLVGTTGSMDFISVVDTGSESSVSTAGVYCSFSDVTIKSSILWTPASAHPSLAGCTIATTSIVGPRFVPPTNGINVDPRFIPADNDYHLSMDSPAKDFVDVGPVTDFEGDARPSGVRFDLGADEAR
jgi:hypothetical protein